MKVNQGMNLKCTHLESNESPKHCNIFRAYMLVSYLATVIGPVVSLILLGTEYYTDFYNFSSISLYNDIDILDYNI
jgi:hypothetical protein